jgi:hypothetical protein
MMLEQMVTEFIADYRAHARAEMDEFRKLSSLRYAIHHAALCHSLPDEKRHPHQYRIPGALLQSVERQLQHGSRKLLLCKSFETLHDEIKGRIGWIKGIGPLTIYDIAHRIGAYIGRSPKLVYLHRGTAMGARRLGFTGKTLDPKLLPSAFSQLEPAEIEDFLCINRDRLLPAIGPQRNVGRLGRPILARKKTCARHAECHSAPSTTLPL